MRPADGERSAIVGFSAQFGLAARIVLPKLPILEWIRVADPAAGVADDFQFKAGPVRHALQVKWSQYPESFTWSALVNPTKNEPALITGLAAAWRRLRDGSSEPLTVHLCTNDHASSSESSAAAPLGRVTAGRPRHFAAFIARAFRPVRDLLLVHPADWAGLAVMPEVREWAAAWEALRVASDLSDDDFVNFIRDFEMHFGLTLDAEGSLEQRDPDLAVLAAEFQAIVADPVRPVSLSGDELLARLGWGHRQRYRNMHRFPVPVVYAANGAARSEVEAQLGAIGGGYLALVGPAGSGKSTLLSSLQVAGAVVRYYAFVPDAPDPLSGRGEAESFLHDVSLLLHEAGIRRTAAGTDLRSQRLVLSDQIEAAGRRWVETQQTTTIIVDGLDHVVREQNPTRSMLEELPGPTGVPEGVYLILGTQTTSILPGPVRAAVEGGNRLINLPPLAPSEVREIADRAGVGEKLLPGQTNRLIEVSEGHPLALTYLLAEVQEVLAAGAESKATVAAVDEVLRDASAYGGDVEQRYRGYLRAVGDDPEVVDLLAGVSRLRGSVNVGWLASWASHHSLAEFMDRTATFFHRVGDDWRFIHNSFCRFLAEQTASVGGVFSNDRDRRLHADLADRCASSVDWPEYRNEALAHRFLAGNYRKVVETAAPDRLRAQLGDELWPMPTVRDHAMLALRAAAELGDYESFVRLLLFSNELWLREGVLEPEKLAGALVEMDEDAAVEHIMRGSVLRISPESAMKHAARFAAQGRTNIARSIVRACGGLPGLIERHHGGRYNHDWAGAVADWAETTWHLSGQLEVLAALDHHLPSVPAQRQADEAMRPDTESDSRARRRAEEEEWAEAKQHCRQVVLQRCLEVACSARDDDAADHVMALIDDAGTPDLRAWVRVVRAITDAEDQDADRVMHWAREILTIDSVPADDQDEDDEVAGSVNVRPVSLHLRSRAAVALAEAGLVDADEISVLVPRGTAVRPPRGHGSDRGLGPYLTELRLRTIRSLRNEAQPDAELGTESPDTALQRRDPAAERFRRARNLLGDLEGQLLMAQAGRRPTPAIAALSDPIIRIFEVPASPGGRGWIHWGPVRGAAEEMFQRLMGLAHRCEGMELSKLLDRFGEAWADRDRRVYWQTSLRHQVLRASMDFPAARVWAQAQLIVLNQELAAASLPIHEAVEQWLEQAALLARCDDDDGARSAARAAVRTSAGLGFHDEDRHLTQCLDWLEAAARDPSFEFPAAVRTYMARILAAPEEASQDVEAAGERLTELVFSFDPAWACAIAEELCESGKMSSASSIAAVVAAASRDTTVSPVVTAALAVDLLLPAAESVPLKVLADIQAAGANVATSVDQAMKVWTPPADRSRFDPSGGDARENAAQPTPVFLSATTAGSLLKQMRAMSENTGSNDDWQQAFEHAAINVATAGVVRPLLVEANRLRVVGAGLGQLILRAAQLGFVAAAEAALRTALAQCSPYGWLRHGDRGARLIMLETALSARTAELVQVAAQDLAVSLSSGVLRDWLRPDDLRRIVEVIGGSDAVAASWPAISSYLDVLAPADLEVRSVEAVPAVSATQALTRWAAGYLGHPVRPFDFGARKVMHAAMQVAPDEAALPLAEAINRKGWAAEAALAAIATMKMPRTQLAVGEPLAAAITNATASPDYICRTIARGIAGRLQLPASAPPARNLPAVYGLELPTLPKRRIPELNHEGVPFIDVTDPVQVIAPFDSVVTVVANTVDIDNPATVFRAATLGLSAAAGDRWLNGGHRAHADRMKRRQERLGYRPWAYMVGRRAVGLLIGELFDAGQIEREDLSRLEFELINMNLMAVELRARDASMPAPWRADMRNDYEASAWIAGVHDAAQAVAEAVKKYSDHHVLAEHTEWRAGSSGQLTELRRLVTSTAMEPDAERLFDEFTLPADLYNRSDLKKWDGGATAVRGAMMDFSDARWHQWLAVHPAVARRLGWSPDVSEPFTWRGSEGEIRAFTILRQIGDPDRRSPGWSYEAFGWQVLITATAHDEMIAAFGPLKRTIHVDRTVKSRDDDDQRPSESFHASVEV